MMCFIKTEGREAIGGTESYRISSEMFFTSAWPGSLKADNITWDGIRQRLEYRAHITNRTNGNRERTAEEPRRLGDRPPPAPPPTPPRQEAVSKTLILLDAKEWNARDKALYDAGAPITRLLLHTRIYKAHKKLLDSSSPTSRTTMHATATATAP